MAPAPEFIKDTIKVSYFRIHSLMRNEKVVSVGATLRSFTVIPMLLLTNYIVRKHIWSQAQVSQQTPPDKPIVALDLCGFITLPEQL
ncbi:MAG: hypothetical protein ACLP5H_08785 [Desulfomonilaceae bacterium]